MEHRVISGIHHITVISGSAQRNFDFYTKVLGLRLVKKTVNFDSPTTYHLYYGDYDGKPGTIMTFFPWENAAQGKPQNGEVTSVMFAIPSQSVDYWMGRLAELGIEFDLPFNRFGDQVIRINDPDLLQLELVATDTVDETAGWDNGEVLAEHSIRGFFGAALSLTSSAATKQLLEHMGFSPNAHNETEHRTRLTSSAPFGNVVDLIEGQNLLGRVGRGSVHHIAFRVEDDEHEAYWMDNLRKLGLQVTPVQDRQYFRSVYFREPGGVLFELATDIPGFAKDENVAQLGEALKLPAWYEERRDFIEASLPQLQK